MKRAHHTMILLLAIVGASVYTASTTDHWARIQPQAHRSEPVFRATLLAFGDVNLGRTLGQLLLSEGAGYVFKNFPIDTADIVFVNLESTLSDQRGETESAASNIVFTGPPVGAMALAQAGITVAATANNHAYDYGERAIVETIDNLDAANIGHVGTTKREADVYEPLCLSNNGLRFALFAVTDFMNLGRRWRQHAASTDTSLLFPKLREAVRTVDAVIVSVHGGDEYADRSSARMQKFARACIDQGARLVLGHHPHVPYGIDSVDGGYIVHSLGNFVFYQPQNEWAQLSYGVMFEFSKTGAAVAVALKRIIPIEAGFQPVHMESAIGREKILARVQKYSTISLKQFH
jgi:poly-gamma-glutamate capsule biosynthesis protein CapA/YwtB (metallophosphatase superfamily)